MQFKINLVVLVLYIITVVYTQDISRGLVFPYTGGHPQCTTCASPQGGFACSNDIGDWRGGKRDFFDPLSFEEYRQGYTLTKIRVTITGTYDCYDKPEGAVINVALNDELVEIKSKRSSLKCECGKCDGSLVFENTYVGGWPGYHYGSYNLLLINIFNDAICLKEAVVNFTFSKQHTNATRTTFDFITDNTTCTACIGLAGHFKCGNTGSRLTQVFRDPLPPKTVATAVSLQWYSKSGGNLITFTVTSYLNDQIIVSDSIQNYRYPNSAPFCQDCAGRVTSSSPLYLAGFPGYNYGGDNTLVFAIGGSVNTLCISRVSVYIQYYYKS